MRAGSIATFGKRRLPVALFLVCACSQAPRTVPRVLDAEPRLGPFVGPYQYEHFIRGELALARGELDAAASAFEEARLGAVDDALIVARLAETELRRERPERALTLVAQAKALDPEAEAAFLVEGMILEHVGRLDEAEASYARASELAPRSDGGPLALAALRLRRERPLEARAALEALMARAPGSVSAARARFALSLEMNDDEALAEATRALITQSPYDRGRVLDAARSALASAPGRALVLLTALEHGEEDDIACLRARALRALDRSEDAERIELVTRCEAPDDEASPLGASRLER